MRNSCFKEALGEHHSPEPYDVVSQEERRTGNSLSGGALTWTKKSSLDYLALDFNSASPGPAQQVGRHLCLTIPRQLNFISDFSDG